MRTSCCKCASSDVTSKDFANQGAITLAVRTDCQSPVFPRDLTAKQLVQEGIMYTILLRACYINLTAGNLDHAVELCYLHGLIASPLRAASVDEGA
jgi:hypothetical protein